MGVLADEAAARGRALVPWGWVPTTLSVAANLHRAIVHDNVPLIEYRMPDPEHGALLRRALAGPEPVIRDGEFTLPTAPGLGVEVDLELVERLRVA
jgi:L-alanine-DL-glutamate epimerase-like enolase superfamily enzyme